jgi:PAS domain-containing protein
MDVNQAACRLLGYERDELPLAGASAPMRTCYACFGTPRALLMVTPRRPRWRRTRHIQ